MRTVHRLRVAIAAVALWSAPLAAQASGATSAPPGAPGAARRDAAQGERALLEQRVRERMARVVRQRLGLDEAQMRRLQETNRRFERQRADAGRREWQARARLRRELSAPGIADQAAVDTLLTVLLGLQRDRVAMLEEEQRALSAFLTPVQRAQYLALQEQVRRRVEDARRKGAARRPALERGDAPPP